MKIDEQRSLVSLSVTTRPRAHDEFMQLLKESKDSLHYDQYYRQYQGQLQQSQLTFAPLQDLQGPLSRGNSPLADKPIKLAHIDESTATEIPTLSIPPPSQATKLINNNPLVPVQTKELTPSKQLDSKLLSFVDQKPDLRKQPIKHKGVEERGIAPTAILKEHQLFIDGQQAEFSVSTYKLKPKEQKELLQMVKTYLKNKGLLLKKLIINGVFHD